MARIFNDSKHFVDMKLRSTPEVTLKSFDAFMSEHKETPDRDAIAKWVEENFEAPGSEFEKWTPADHTKTPSILGRIADKQYKEWAANLNDVWLQLGRKMTKDVKVSHEMINFKTNRS